MEPLSEGNPQIENRDVFAVFNPYFLLFFSVSCILSSVFVQQVVLMMGQLQLALVAGPLIGIVLPVFLLTYRFPPGFWWQLRIGGVRFRLAFYTVVATLAAIVIIDYVSLFTQQFAPVPETYVDFLMGMKPTGPGTFAITFVGLCVAVPFAEEIVFRGMIQRVMARNMPGALAVILAAIFFGGIHLNPPLLPSLICFGVLAGFIFHVCDNLSYAILAHAVLNGVALVKLTLASANNLDDSPYYLHEPWFLGLALLVLTLLVIRIKKEAALSRLPLETFEDLENR